jgi:hypothetical protein
MIITRKTEDVSRELTRAIRALRGLAEAFAPMIEQAVDAAENRPWWDLFGKMFGPSKRTVTVAVAGLATAESLDTLIARLESMKHLCDNYGATEVQVSHEDMYHIFASQQLISHVSARLEGEEGA